MSLANSLVVCVLFHVSLVPSGEDDRRCVGWGVITGWARGAEGGSEDRRPRRRPRCVVAVAPPGQGSHSPSAEPVGVTCNKHEVANVTTGGKA